eukprot:1228424-Ditylum_brightwellii.AAC.1
MGHKQPATTIVTDNNTAHGRTQGTMVAKCSKAMDMQFHWLKCCAAQKQFNIKWKRMVINKADYHSNHHPPPPHTHTHTHTHSPENTNHIYLVNSEIKEHDIPAHIHT